MEITRLVICTTNKGKIAELKALLPSDLRLITLEEAGIELDHEETGTTFQENAIQKARVGAKLTNCQCIADDSGLEVDALDGRPGVFSARYAGGKADSLRNMEKLLHEMKDITDRKAKFRTVIAYVSDELELLFEGVVEGRITHEPIGEHGFGYDPIFIPAGKDRTFAEMDIKEKNAISHRGRAIDSLRAYLERQSAPNRS